MKYKTIKLTSLVPKTITRQRGTEAFNKLRLMLSKDEWIELDLSDADHLRFWDGETGELLFVCAAHDAPVQSLAVAPTGAWFASADAAGDVAIWDARP